MFSSHAADILKTYGTTGSRLGSWRSALEEADPFPDVGTGARGVMIHWERQPDL